MLSQHNRAGESGMIGQTRNATWKRQDYLTLPVTINKTGSLSQINITGQKGCQINSGNDLSGYSITGECHSNPCITTSKRRYRC